MISRLGIVGLCDSSSGGRDRWRGGALRHRNSAMGRAITSRFLIATTLNEIAAECCRPACPQHIRLNQLLFEIQPNLGILTAVVRAAGERTVRPHAALAGSAPEMGTIPVRILRNHVRLLRVPTDDAFGQILLRKRKRQFATGRPAQMHPVLAIDRGYADGGVFVLPGILLDPDQHFPSSLQHRPRGRDPLTGFSGSTAL